RGVVLVAAVAGASAVAEAAAAGAVAPRAVGRSTPMPKGLNWKEVTGVAGLEGHWLRRKYFSPVVLQALAERIHASEAGHTGELVLAVEAVSPLHEPDSHARALEVFGRLRVWDTPHNTGVLLYLALDRHHIQVIADRGVTAPDAA